MGAQRPEKMRIWGSKKWISSQFLVFSPVTDFFARLRFFSPGFCEVGNFSPGFLFARFAGGEWHTGQYLRKECPKHMIFRIWVVFLRKIWNFRTVLSGVDPHLSQVVRICRSKSKKCHLKSLDTYKNEATFHQGDLGGARGSVSSVPSGKITAWGKVWNSKKNEKGWGGSHPFNARI